MGSVLARTSSVFVFTFSNAITAWDSNAAYDTDPYGYDDYGTIPAALTVAPNTLIQTSLNSTQTVVYGSILSLNTVCNTSLVTIDIPLLIHANSVYAQQNFNIAPTVVYGTTITMSGLFGNNMYMTGLPIVAISGANEFSFVSGVLSSCVYGSSIDLNTIANTSLGSSVTAYHIICTGASIYSNLFLPRTFLYTDTNEIQQGKFERDRLIVLRNDPFASIMVNYEFDTLYQKLNNAYYGNILYCGMYKFEYNETDDTITISIFDTPVYKLTSEGNLLVAGTIEQNATLE
jgi:hypothetical protein